MKSPVPGVHYGIRQGDRVALIDQHREPGVERIENGSRGEVLDINQAGEVLIEFDVTGRQATLSGEDDLAKLRLGYAQHIHRAQGATVTRTLVVTGGWQTSKEPAYVEASRARQGTDWFVSRQDLGTEGHDTDRIQRLAAEHAPQPRADAIARAPRAARPRLRHPLSPLDCAQPHQPHTGHCPHGDQPGHQPTSTGTNTMSQRRQIVLPDPVDQQLRELAASADTPPSTLAAHIVEAGVAQAANDGKVRPLRPTPALVGARGDERAPWLEPYGGDTEWRRQMWGAIVALHGRYPTQLANLKDKWWTDESTTETLMCARNMASRTRRYRARPPRRAGLPEPARRLLPASAPAGRRRHEGMATRRSASRVGAGVTHTR